MKRRLLAMLLCIAMISIIALPAQAAEGNMEGGGGETGQAGSGHGWDGLDGVRVTVIEKATKKAVGETFDWTNYTPPAGVISFAKRNKLQYLAGSTLAPNHQAYVYKTPEIPLPTVINASGGSNIVALKAYFTDETVAKVVAKHAKISYSNLISGKFTVLIEPIAIFRYNNIRYAMTATEAGLYDRAVHGGLRAAVGFLTHQNQPLAMYLEVAELGIAAGGGGGTQDDAYIISTLGIGTVNFGDLFLGESDLGEETEAQPYDYEYHGDTDVVTTITISTSSEINPDNEGSARFNLPNGSITKNYVIPEDESQDVWVKWHTPDVEEDTIVEIPVNISGGSADKATIVCKIIAFEENTPPNPEGRDLNAGFSLKTSPTAEKTDSLTWGEWWAQWHENWVYERTGHSNNCEENCERSHGRWVDEGWWDFFWRSYSASLSVTAKTAPDEHNPTARGTEIKSGYGINGEVQVNMNTNGGADNTCEVQYVVAVFPEFDFETYDRFLEPEGGSVGYNKQWAFKPNEYSQFTAPAHFTPIWYPDNQTFPVSFTTYDAWTPAGQLTYTLTASDIAINGNVYDDWHIAPGFGNK